MEDLHIRDGVVEAYTGREAAVAVPEGVHTIGKGAFKACVSMRKILFPRGLRRIEAEAFKGCRNLEEAVIPDGVSAIGEYAFHRCHSLKKIALPDSVTELGDCAFLYCDGLEEARIPGVCRVGAQAFVNDVSLRRLEISAELEEECICDVFTGCGGLQEVSFAEKEPGQRERSLADKGTYRFPNAVEVVAGEMDVPRLVRVIAVDILRMMELEGRCLVTFRTNLKHVDIPEGIEAIGKSCFFDKRGIGSVRFPRSLREIGSRAFRNCINLEKVIFEGNAVCVHEDAFKNCSSLKMIQMPGNLQYVLEGIAGLQGTEAPEQVRLIQRQVLGNFRISGSILLKYLGEEPRVTVPEGITVIAEDAFAGNEAVDRVLLPESLREVGAGAFRDCVLLQSIEFPERLERIGTGAFENCVKLLRVKLWGKLTKINGKTFKKCRALKEISFGEGIREIGEQAFYGCAAVREVSFPKRLRFLGDMAFCRCEALRNVHLLPGIKSVGNLAFSQSGVRRGRISGGGEGYGTGIFADCVKLKSLCLEEGVCHIADRLAYGCTALEEVKIPSSVRSVGKNVWEKTLFLENWLREGRETEAEILWDGRNLEGALRFPETVRVVAGGAFYGNKNLTALHIPKGIRWVGPAAFKGCSGLRQVEWETDGCMCLEAEVFSGCTGLERVGSLPWQSVGERAFYGCGNLREVCLEEAAQVGKEAFSRCTQLKVIFDHSSRQGSAAECTSASPGYKTQRSSAWFGENAFDGTFLEKGPEGMPATAGTIVISGKSCRGVLRLPEGITGIAPFAFSGNREITGVVIPESLQRIGEGAFWGCSGLAEVSFPKKGCWIDARAFQKCIALREVNLRADRLGASAFAYCISLKRASIIGKTILPEGLFEGCRALEECICPNVRAVKANCFNGCGQLKSFDFSRVHVVRESAFEGCGNLKRAAFPDGACIKAHAFEDCCSLEEIVLLGQQGEVRLWEYAFSGCTCLVSAVFRGKTWRFGSYSDILDARIPETVRLIFHSAMSCFAVEKEEILTGYRGFAWKVRIPKGIRRIEAEVFRDAPALEEAEIPDSVEYIGARAFHGTAWMERQRALSPMVTVNHMLLDGSGCSGMVEVGPGIRLVCGWAFANGMGIEGIRFYSERTQVGEYAFRNCIYLREFILPDGCRVAMGDIRDRDRELPPLAKQAVTDSLNCFKTDENGVLKECTGNIARLRVAEGVTAIGEGAFQEGNLLTEIILPATVKRIGRRAFRGCKWLRAVRQAGSVEEIEEMAFYGCGALETVELSDRVRSIGARAFENCTSLREILIPDGAAEIPFRAFYRCHSLAQVCFPPGLKRIGKEAFAFCRELREVRLAEGVAVEERAFAGCKSEAGANVESMPEERAVAEERANGELALDESANVESVVAEERVNVELASEAGTNGERAFAACPVPDGGTDGGSL